MGLTLKIDWQYGGYTGTFIDVQDYAMSYSSGEATEEDFNGQAWYLFEGNASCDCNRRDLIADVMGRFPWEFQNVHNWDIEGEDWGCGNNIIYTHVEFWHDGRLIGTGRDSRLGYEWQYKESPVVIPTILEQAIILTR